MKRLVSVMMICLTVVMAYSQAHGQRHHYGPHQQRIVCAGEENAAIIAQTLHSLSFSEQKMNVAKMCVRVMPLCTLDLKMIVAEFSYDNDRLEYLKYAYDYVSDPWNYHTLKDSFSFKTNFDELLDFISGPRR